MEISPYKLLQPLIWRSRREKFERFMALVTPSANDWVLNDGAGFYGIRASDNFLEGWYPYPERITALDVTLRGAATFRSRHPKPEMLCADGLALPFPDDTFDIGFSNAVVEHVGDRERQQRYVRELLRVSRKVCVITPDRAFPVDIHMLVPFAHWLPRSLQRAALRPFGRQDLAETRVLNLLSWDEFRRLFPAELKVKFLRIRLLGLPYSMIGFACKTD